MNGLRAILARGYGAAWEVRRRAYAWGLVRQTRVPARVVSVGNLTVGGTGKTTLTLHLARRAHAAGLSAAVVCRRYRPGPSHEGDEERLYRDALGADAVFAGVRKLDLAARAAGAGRRLVVVDDGFSHWPLARDLDVVLLDAGDPLGGRRLLPDGRLREPLRALQRADAIVLSRVPAGGADPALVDAARRLAPGAVLAAGRHRIAGLRRLSGGGTVEAIGPALVVTGTGRPSAVEASAREAGFAPVTLSPYRDHHWFTRVEAEREIARARAMGASLVLTAKDAVRWPAPDPVVAVLEVEWEWVQGGEAVERMVLGGTPGGAA